MLLVDGLVRYDLSWPKAPFTEPLAVKHIFHNHKVNPCPIAVTPIFKKKKELNRDFLDVCLCVEITRSSCFYR